MKYTPGPWVYNKEYDRVCSGKEVICYGSPNFEANAPLIAAAPELLEALRGLVGAHLAAPGPRGVMLDVPHFLEQAEAAIAKAEG